MLLSTVPITGANVAWSMTSKEKNEMQTQVLAMEKVSVTYFKRGYPHLKKTCMCALFSVLKLLTSDVHKVFVCTVIITNMLFLT